MFSVFTLLKLNICPKKSAVIFPCPPPFKTVFDILQAIASRLLVYSSPWGPVNVTGFGNWFHTEYLRL